MAEVPRPCPWHAGAWSALVARLGGRLPHALLFTGPAGTGKRLFADAFAARLLCDAPTEVACGRCRACLLVAAGTHPDLLLVVPEAQRADAADGEGEGEGGRGKRKPSREIRIDEVRQLIAFAAQTAQFGGRRVVVIDPAHAMNVNAANALLKTLEEPGQGTVLLLVSDVPGQLAATIRSRCQPLPLPAPDRAAALDWLAARIGDRGRAEALLNAAGTPLRALALETAGDEWPGMRPALARVLVDTLCGRESAVRCAQLLSEAPETLVLDWLPGLLADAVRLAAGAPAASLANPDLAPLLTALVEARTTQPLFLLGDDLSRLRQQLQANTGLNRPLLWEEVLLRWSHRPARGRQEVGNTP